MKLKYLLACSVACAAAAAVAATPVDWGEMEPNVVYNYDPMVTVMGTFTPSENGTIRCYSTGGVISPYDDSAHENPIESSNSYYGASGEKVRTYSVTQGKTLYFYNGTPLDGGTFRIVTGDEEVVLASVIPAAGDSPVSLSSNYNVTLSFTIPVKCTKCTIAVNGESSEITPSVSNTYITLNWFNTVKEWYRTGKLKGGDTLTITVTGIRDAGNSGNRPNFGDGVGKLILNYKMAGKPAELVWEKGTPVSGVSDFYSYYLPGGDDGIVSFTFSDDLDPNCHPLAEISYGDPDNIELGMYKERPPVTMEGKTVSVNLQGVKRFPEDMVPGLAAQNFIDLTVSGIKSADGQYVLTGYASSPYSFGYSYNFKTLVYSIAADWVPLAGSQLVGGEEMEIWVLNGHRIMFDSVDFSYVKDGQPAKLCVPYSDLRVEDDTTSEDALMYYLSVPALEADPDSEISVTFGGLKCADGLDHDSDILVKYKSATAGVEGIEVAEGDHIYYDLTGRRVASPEKGIYILNGKKTVIK